MSTQKLGVRALNESRVMELREEDAGVRVRRWKHDFSRSGTNRSLNQLW